MDKIQSDIRKLVSYGVKTGLVPEEDVIFTTNRLLELFGLDELEDSDEEFSMEESELEKVLGSMCDYAYEKGLMKMIENYGKEAAVQMLETANDITWELNHNYFPIDDMAGFVKVLDEAKNANSPLYWGYYKLVNRIK